MKEPTASSRRLTGLDALRGLAALAVVVYHYTHHFDVEFGTQRDLLFRFTKGHLGVQLFFVISGFVILMTLERSRSILDFTVARFSRLYPAFWCAALMSWAVIRWADIPYMRISTVDAAMNVTMIPGVLGFHRIDGVYWTLEVELMFYLLMGAIFALRLRRRLLPILAAIITLKISDAIYGWFPASHPSRSLLVLDHLHLFTPGIVIYLARDGWRASHLAMLALSYLATASDQHRQFGPDAVPLHTAAVMAIGAVCWAATRWNWRPLEWRPAQFLGAISYTLYLVHANLGYVILHKAHHAGWNPNLTVAIATLASLCAAAAVTWGVEKPAMAWIRSRWKSRPGSVDSRFNR
jgi:peptidoglycan/LPS O-acetylase OafA/YrhL